MRLYLFVLLVFSHWAGLLFARTGVDLSIETSRTEWTLLFPQPAQNRNFAVIHGQFYNNTLNADGLRSVANAWKAGVLDLSLYFYPCVPQSAYEMSTTNLTCPSATAQLDTFITELASWQMSFFNTTNHTNAEILQQNPYAHPSIWNASGDVVLNRLFVNLEDMLPNHYFSEIHYRNVQFLSEFVDRAQELGVDVGVYTSLQDWNAIMTEEINRQTVYLLSPLLQIQANPFSHLKLWTPRFDGQNDMTFFRPFADWNATFIKQTTGGSKAARRVGSSRICTNFMADNETLAL